MKKNRHQNFGVFGIKIFHLEYLGHPPIFSAAEPQQHDTNDHRIELMDTTTWWFAHSSWKLWNVQAKQRSLEDFNWASDLQLVVLRHPLLATAPGAVDVFMFFFFVIFCQRWCLINALHHVTSVRVSQSRQTQKTTVISNLHRRCRDS